MKIERSPDFRIKVRGDDSGFIVSQSVEANILYEILQELKRIRGFLPSRLDPTPEDGSKTSGGSISVDHSKGE